MLPCPHQPNLSKSIGADWAYLIEIIKLVCPHPVKPDVVVKLVRVRRQLFGHMILVLGEGIIFLLGVSAGRRLHTKKERGENRSYLAEFRYCRSQDAEEPHEETKASRA